MMNSSQRGHATLRGYAFIAGAALFWGISASLGKAAFSGKLIPGGQLAPIDPLILAQSRTTLSLAILAPLLVITRRSTRSLRMGWHDRMFCLLLGIAGVAASNYFYYLSIQKTNVATAIILQYTAPIWVLLYMLARRLQHATVKRILSVGLAIVGSALAIGAFSGGAMKINTVGVIAAELAALSFAFYNILGGKMVDHYDRWTVLLYVLLGAAIFWQIVNPPWKIAAAHYSPTQWSFMLVFSITSILIPFSLYFGGLQYLDATKAIVTSCLEPVFSIMIAAVFLREVLGLLQTIGVLIVLSATILVQIPDRWHSESRAIEPIE